MAAPEPNTIAVLSIAGVLAATPFGVNVGTIGLGVGFAVLGLLGRFAFDVQKSLEGGDKVRFISALGWLGAGLIGAPFLTVLWIVMLRSIGAQTDIATVIGLLFLGFTGPKGILWLLGLVGNFIGRIGFPKGSPEPPKP